MNSPYLYVKQFLVNYFFFGCLQKITRRKARHQKEGFVYFPTFPLL